MKRRSLFLLMAALFLSVFGCALPQSGEAPAAPEEGVVRIGDTVYATIHDAVEHASNGDTLVLLKDIEINRTVEIRGKEITLIPEGNRTILRCPAFRKELFYIAEDGGLHLEGQKGELIIDGNKENVASIIWEKMTKGEPLLRKKVRSLIKNDGETLLIEKITLCNNKAYGCSGGAIWNSGTLVLDGGIIQNNETDIEGGGVYNDKGGTVVIKKGEIIKNSVNGRGLSFILSHKTIQLSRGGGISNCGNIVIEDGEILRNQCCDRGGGIFNGSTGTCIVKKVRILENKGNQGGGICTHRDGTVQFQGGEIKGNSANWGKDYYVYES